MSATPATKRFDRTATAAALSLCLAVILGTGSAWAHGSSGGGTHTGSSLHATLTTPNAPTPITPIAASAMGPHALPGTQHTAPSAARAGSISAASPLSPPAPEPTLPSTVVQGCEGAVEVNCLATAQSQLGASGGDTAPVWSAPLPTTLPPEPSSAPITEPAQDTSLPPEDSGGASGVVITAGGGPTLADCMALWEPKVHMSKSLWRSVCVRTMNGIEEPSLAIHSVDPAAPAHASTKSASAARN